MSDNTESIRNRVVDVLVRAGFRVEAAKPPVPPDVDWALDVYTPPPFNVHLRFFHSSQRGMLVAGIGIGLAEPHRAAIARLPPEQRVKLAARLISAIISVCPHCRLSVQPNIFSPERIVSEEGVVDPPDPQRVLDMASRLVNVFITVNTVLWEFFPDIAVQQAEQRGGGETVYM